MILPFVALALLAQKTPAETQALQKYRYGKTSAQIEAMGLDAYQRLFDRQTPDAGPGTMRGVAYGVYVDAYRENTERRYRKPLPKTTQTRLLAIDKQIRFVGVLFARSDWLFSGGNAFDPDGDSEDYAMTERQLYTSISEVPDPQRTKRRLTDYRKETLAKARREKMYGVFGPQKEGVRTIEDNCAKIERAMARAIALCRTPGERAIVYGFVADEAKQRL